MPTYVALLRAINVGGKNMVSMKELKASFEKLGFQDVATYINSGNILFRDAATDTRKIEEKIDRMLARDFGLKSKSLVRSYRQMANLVKTMSKTWPRADPAWRYNVIFLRDGVNAKRVLAEIDIEPDCEEVVPCPGTLLWSAQLAALPRTAMLKLGSRPIFQDMTVRNINTTSKLLELMRRMEESS